MKPWQHAHSSARSYGGPWLNYLPFHEFVDQTKAAYGHITHRYLLHSVDMGLHLTGMVFGEKASSELLPAHIAEDMSIAATLADWLSAIRPALLPKSRRPGRLSGMSPEIQGRAVAEGMKLEDATLAVSVAGLLALPDRLAPHADAAVRSVAMRNTMGAFIAEKCLGVGAEVARVGGGTCFVGVRDLAETLIIGETGSLLPYSDIARAVEVRDWMYIR